MDTRLYGITNCDTVRKARRWLDDQGVPYEFHDFKKKGIESATLSAWAVSVGWENLLNRRSATWRALPDSDKENLTEKSALALLKTHPTLIKRPVLSYDTTVLVGFTPAAYKPLSL